MVWHYHDDDVSGPVANVKVNLTSIPNSVTNAKVTRYLIDADHSNSFTAWQKMGLPQQPTPEQYAQLEKAGALAQVGSPTSETIANRELTLDFPLARQGVTLLVLTFD